MKRQADDSVGSAGKKGIAKPKGVDFVRMRHVNNKRDNIPEILKTDYKAHSCSKNENCGRKGAKLVFNVTFQLVPKTFGKHSAKFGLRRGRLCITMIKPLRVQKISPQPQIETKITTETETTHTQRHVLGTDSFSSSKQSESKKGAKRLFYQVLPGGGPDKPFWSFEAYEDELLVGIKDGLELEFAPDEHLNCGLKYQFIVEDGDWHYKLEVLSKGLRKKFIEFKLKPICERRKESYNNLVASKYMNIMSNGSWKCQITKK